LTKTALIYIVSYFNLGVFELCFGGLTGPVLVGAGTNGRPRRGVPLSSGVITSSCSVNRPMTFMTEIFRKDPRLLWQAVYFRFRIVVSYCCQEKQLKRS